MEDGGIQLCIFTGIDGCQHFLLVYSPLMHHFPDLLCSVPGTSAGQVVAVDDVKIRGDEFWDYDQQVDLEAFSTKDFYSTLSKQSSEVTSALARQKDQVSEIG